MQKYQPLATVAATALLAASYAQRARNEAAEASVHSTDQDGTSHGALIAPDRHGALIAPDRYGALIAPDRGAFSSPLLFPYTEDEYSEDAARRIGLAFRRLGIDPGRSA